MDDYTMAAWAGRTAFAGAAVLALGRAALLAVRPAAARQALAAWTVRAAVLAALLALLPAWWAVPLPLKPVAEVPAAPEPLPEQPLEIVVSVDPPEVAADDEPGEFVRLPLPPELPDVTAAPKAEPPAVAAPAAAPAWPAGVQLLLAVYAAGAAFFLAEFALGHLALGRLRRASRPASPRVQAAAAALTAGRSPRVMVSDTLASPVCFGVLRPTVVLPARLARGATAAELSWVLAHEADHLRRGDPLTGWFAGIAKALFFFAPWFWGVRRELRLAQEYLADAAALAAGGTPADYAEFLVDLAADPARGRNTVLAHGVRAGRSDLSRRITMVLSTTPARGPRRAAIPALTLLGAAVLLSGLGLARAEDPPKSPPAPPEPPKRVELRVEVQADDKPKPAAPTPPLIPATPAPATGMPKTHTDIHQFGNADGSVTVTVSFDSAKLAELRKKIEAGAKAGNREDVMKLVGELEKALTSALPAFPAAPPTPPRPAAPPAALVRPVGPSAEAVQALEKALESITDPAVRAAVLRAIEQHKAAPQAGSVYIDPPSVQVMPNGLGGRVRVTNSADFGQLFRGAFGVGVDAVPEALAEQLQLPAGSGVLVMAVVPDMPFGKAGLKKNDVITKIDGTGVTGGVAGFVKAVGDARAGNKTLAVTYLSKGKEARAEVVTGPAPVPPKAAAAKKVKFESKSVSVTNDTFKIEAKAGEVEYKITGKLADGKIESYEARIYEGKDVTVLNQTRDAVNTSERGQKYVPAVKALLDSVRGN